MLKVSNISWFTTLKNSFQFQSISGSAKGSWWTGSNQAIKSWECIGREYIKGGASLKWQIMFKNTIKSDESHNMAAGV